MRALPALALTTLACAAAVPALAQSNVKPPQAQAWIDIATYSGMGMPMGMGGAGAGGANPLSALGGLFGGASGANRFGHTQDGSSGRWVDVTLYSRTNASLPEAQQAVPAGFLSPALTLQSPKDAKPQAAPERDEPVDDQPYERPKGKLLLYWGCGESVRAGQPRVLDMASATPADLAKFFVGRRATQRGAHSAAGRPVWPSPKDARMVPEKASLVGEHQFSGAGVPEGFRFSIPAAQDLMPAIALQQADAGGATQLSWNALPTARAYFAAAMGGKGENEMVIWTSSELPDTGFGLIDYQTNAAVDRWLGEKVLMKPSQTSCAIPKGVFADGRDSGAFLRLIAYGSELNLAHPPRPADPTAPWEPVWAAKLRVKSVASAVLGMPSMAEADAQPKPADKPATPNAIDLLRGVLGR